MISKIILSERTRILHEIPRILFRRWCVGLRASTSAVVSSNRTHAVGPGMFRKDTQKPPEVLKVVWLRHNIRTIADTDPVPTGAPEPGTPPIPQQQPA